jgi:hypothetical protein
MPTAPPLPPRFVFSMASSKLQFSSSKSIKKFNFMVYVVVVVLQFRCGHILALATPNPAADPNTY